MTAPRITSDRSAPAAETAPASSALERRGRAWLLWSFLLCPCHLPLTLAVLASVFAGTSFGVVLRDHAWMAGTVIIVAWVGGTGYGLRLIRQAERTTGACPMPAQPRRLILGSPTSEQVLHSHPGEPRTERTPASQPLSVDGRHR